MNWTTTPPTKPGFYAWRENENWDSIAMTLIENPNDEKLGLVRVGDWEAKPVPKGGQWLRLVPAEEVMEAYSEGFRDADIFDIAPDGWPRSRAKQIAEGTYEHNT